MIFSSLFEKFQEKKTPSYSIDLFSIFFLLLFLTAIVSAFGLFGQLANFFDFPSRLLAKRLWFKLRQAIKKCRIYFLFKRSSVWSFFGIASKYESGCAVFIYYYYFFSFDLGRRTAGGHHEPSATAAYTQLSEFASFALCYILGFFCWPTNLSISSGAGPLPQCHIECILLLASRSHSSRSVLPLKQLTIKTGHLDSAQSTTWIKEKYQIRFPSFIITCKSMAFCPSIKDGPEEKETVGNAKYLVGRLPRKTDRHWKRDAKRTAHKLKNKKIEKEPMIFDINRWRAQERQTNTGTLGDELRAVWTTTGFTSPI